MTDAGLPIAEVFVDGTRATCARVEVTDSRLTPIGRAILSIDKAQSERVVLRNRATVAIGMGYQNTGLRKVFGGRIRHVDPGDVAVGVVALDAMADLEGMRVKRSFANASLQDVVRASLDEHQVRHELASTETRRARHFVAPNLSLLQVLAAARTTWGAQDWDLWADVDGKVWFGPWAETARSKADPVGDLEYGSNLLAFEPSTRGTGMAETLLAPEIEHSRRVRLWHRDLWQGALTVRIDRATHVVVGDQVAKTRLEWTLAS
jgi:hypothetical protein